MEDTEKTQNQDQELTSEDLDQASGGAKNSDNPFVRTALDAFNKTVADADAAAKLELARNSGVLGPSAPWKP